MSLDTSITKERKPDPMVPPPVDPEAPPQSADAFDLIRMLARLQKDPRRAVADLVQNALDAGARHVLITRHRSGGKKALAIRDDGRGVLPGVSRYQALTSIAASIGGSHHRGLSAAERYRLVLQGEGDVGLLGFWCVGRVLELHSKVGAEPVHVLRLEKDSPDIQIRQESLELDSGEVWTEVRVLKLHEGASRQMVGWRLAEFLGRALSRSLLDCQAEVHVVDHLARDPSRRENLVVPQRFKGVGLEQFKVLAVEGYQLARMQLFYLPPRHSERGMVALLSAGELLVEDMTSVPDLDQPPWNSGLLAGQIDFPDLEKAPGMDQGLILNNAAGALFGVLEAIAPAIDETVSRIEEEKRREIDAAVVKRLWRLFQDLDDGALGSGLFETGGRDSDTSAANGAAGIEAITSADIDELFSSGPDPAEPGPAALPAGDGPTPARAFIDIPDPEPVHSPHLPWRSRLIGGRWEYNAGHPDYLACADDPRRKLRYMVSILAKELVCRQRCQPDVREALEQMAGILARVEGRMPRR